MKVGSLKRSWTVRFRVLSDYLKYTFLEELVLLDPLPLMLVVCEILYCSLSEWKLNTIRLEVLLLLR